MSIRDLRAYHLQDRLRVAVPQLRYVGSGVSMAAVQRAPTQKPAAWVLGPPSDQVGENRLTTQFVRKRVVEKFPVVFCVQNARDSRGEEAGNDSEAMKWLIVDALENWTPPVDGVEPLNFVGGPGLILLDGVAVWAQVEFTATGYLVA